MSLMRSLSWAHAPPQTAAVRSPHRDLPVAVPSYRLLRKPVRLESGGLLHPADTAEVRSLLTEICR